MPTRTVAASSVWQEVADVAADHLLRRPELGGVVVGRMSRYVPSRATRSIGVGDRVEQGAVALLDELRLWNARSLASAKPAAALTASSSSWRSRSERSWTSTPIDSPW